jgi:hypothetical protein
MAYRAQGGSVAKRTLAVSRFKGVDLAGNPTAKSPARADWAINMVTDMNGYPQTRHGYALADSFDERINGIYTLDAPEGQVMLVHAGRNLYEWNGSTHTLLYEGLDDVKSCAAQLNNKLVLLDGNKARLVWYEQGTLTVDLLENQGKEPIVVLNALPGPTPGGTAYEPVNLMSDYQYNYFYVAETNKKGIRSGVGTYTYQKNPFARLTLSDSPVSDVTVERMTDEGLWQTVTQGEGTDYCYTSIDTDKGIVDFGSANENYYDKYALAASPITGQSNYRVRFKSEHNITTSHEDDFDLDSPQTNIYWCWPSGAWGNLSRMQYEGWWSDTDPGSNRYRYVYRSFKLKYSDFDDTQTVRFLLTNTIKARNADQKGYDPIDWGHTFACKLTEDFPSPYIISTDPGTDYGKIYIGEWDDGDSHWYDLQEALLCRYRVVEDDVWFDIIHQSDYYDSSRIYDGYGNFRGISALTAYYTGAGNDYKDRVNLADILCKYGVSGSADRLFVAGEPGEKHKVFWSELNDPTYFPDTNYFAAGDETRPVMGFSWLSDGTLAVHKAAMSANSTVYYIEPTTYNGEYTFAMKQGAIGIGVVSKRCGGYLVGTPLQLSSQGVFATVPVGNAAINERFAQNRSYFINPLLVEQDLTQAEAVVFRDKYYLAAGDYVFVADGLQTAGNQKGDKLSYEWYVWDNVPVRVWYASDSDLYFGTADGKIFRFTDGYEDDGEPVKWEWTTPWLDFGTLSYYKKVKNVSILAAPDLWQDPHVEYRFPIKQGKTKILTQTKEQDAPWLKTTNYKAKKIGLMQVHIFGDKPCGLSAINILYSISGKIKG